MLMNTKVGVYNNVCYCELKSFKYTLSNMTYNKFNKYFDVFKNILLVSIF